MLSREVLCYQEGHHHLYVSRYEYVLMLIRAFDIRDGTDDIDCLFRLLLSL
jgi:hypothetical protein